MKNLFRFILPAITLVLSLTASATPTSAKTPRGLATITGTVRDNRGLPLAGAVVQLIRESANQIVKETRTAADGSFSLRIPAGRYSLKAIAAGFSEVLFSSVQVNPSAEIAYRFNLEPASSSRTLVNQRSDRDNVKWTLRSVQTRRAIFQADEGDDPTIAAVDDAAATEQTSAPTTDVKRDPHGRLRPQGVLESYYATAPTSDATGYEGINFAVALPASERIDFIFAGQTGTGAAPQRFETTAKVRVNDRHRVDLTTGAVRLWSFAPVNKTKRNVAQASIRAIDEWIVRDGVVVVLGLDYSRFVGSDNGSSISPRLGIQFDANARTRVKAAFAPGGNESADQSTVGFENSEIIFKQPIPQPIAFVGGRAVMGQSRRLELGMERAIDNRSRIEATAFLDLIGNRGVGLMATPLSSFSGDNGAAITSVADQQGSARGVRVVYSRRLNHVWSTSAGYALGRGQRLSPNGIENPADLFDNAFFQTAALQLAGDWSTGTHVQTVFRFSPQATVFAIDPFAGQLAVYDPSLSVQVSQDLPSFGLPVRAQAIIDARNLFDFQPRTTNGKTLLEIGPSSRSLRGGILFRF
jgi:Carboxypeptidase regulatory-like domain